MIRRVDNATVTPIVRGSEFLYPGIRGQGMAIAIIDSGFDLDNFSFGADPENDGVSHRITFQYDFAENDGNASDSPSFPDSHGTFVASLAAGAVRTAENPTFRGVAPEANIIALKVARDAPRVLPNGSLTPDIRSDAVLSALDWVIANASARNIVAVNMSLGAGNFNQAIFLSEFSSRFRSLEDLGVITVTATGNAYAVDSNPTLAGHQQFVPGVGNFAAAEYTIAVGAVMDTNVDTNLDIGQWQQLANQQVYFSQRHERLLDVLAPGAQMVGAAQGATFRISNGTSFSTPLVAGTAVLVQQQAQLLLGRRLKTSEFRTLLQNSPTSLRDLEVVEGTTDALDVPNLGIGIAFPVLNVASALFGVSRYAVGTPRAIANAAIVQPTSGVGAARSATFSWDSSPESQRFDVWVNTVTTVGIQRPVWQNLVYNPSGPGAGVIGTSVVASWTAAAGDTDQYIWWVRAWDGPALPSALNHGEWSIQRRLYLVPNVPVPVAPSFVAPTNQPLNNIDINFSSVAYASVYDIEVERLVAFPLNSGSNTATGAFTTGLLRGQTVVDEATASAIPVGTTIVAVTSDFPDPTTAPDWLPNTVYLADIKFGVLIPATGTFVAIDGRTLRNGNRYILDYPTARTSGALFTPIEAALTRKVSSVNGDTTITLSQNATATRANAELVIGGFLSVLQTTSSRFRPQADYMPGTYRTRAQAWNRQAEPSGWGPYQSIVVTDHDYPDPVYLGARSITTNHTFVFTDPNPIGQYLVRVIIGATDIQEQTTESSLRFNQPLPIGSGIVVIYSLNESGQVGNQIVTQYPIDVTATVPVPAAPVYSGLAVFTGDVTLSWSKTVEANSFVVLVQRDNITIVNVATHFGNSISLDSLKSGEIRQNVWHTFAYTLFLRARNSSAVLSAWSVAFPLTIARTAIAPPTAVVTTVPGSTTLRKFDWVVDTNAKYYEIWIGRENESGTGAVATSNSDFIMVSALVKDEGTFYASLGTGNYRVWLRAWSHEDNNSFGSAWTPGNGVGFTVV